MLTESGLILKQVCCLAKLECRSWNWPIRRPMVYSQQL
jgi:hypothetical protein